VSSQWLVVVLVRIAGLVLVRGFPAAVCCQGSVFQAQVLLCRCRLPALVVVDQPASLRQISTARDFLSLAFALDLTRD